jgi:hypothetical protein
MDGLATVSSARDVSDKQIQLQSEHHNAFTLSPCHLVTLSSVGSLLAVCLAKDTNPW